MQAGNQQPAFSRIVRAISSAERFTTAEIRVHISKRWIERDPMRRARTLFHRLGMNQTREHSGVLIYINLRRNKFAILGDEGIHRQVGDRFWQEVARDLQQDLRRTHHENAIAIAVHRIGDELARRFPAKPGAGNPNELSNDVSVD